MSTTNLGYYTQNWGWINQASNSPAGVFEIGGNLNMNGYDIYNASSVLADNIEVQTTLTNCIQKTDGVDGVISSKSRISETRKYITKNTASVVISADELVDSIINFTFAGTITDITFPDYADVLALLNCYNSSGVSNNFNSFDTKIINSSTDIMPDFIAGTSHSFSFGAESNLQVGQGRNLISLIHADTNSYNTIPNDDHFMNTNNLLTTPQNLSIGDNAGVSYLDSNNIANNLNIGSSTTSDVNIGRTGKNVIIDGDNLKVNSILPNGAGPVTIDGEGLLIYTPGSSVEVHCGDVSGAPPTGEALFHVEGRDNCGIIISAGEDGTGAPYFEQQGETRTIILNQKLDASTNNAIIEASTKSTLAKNNIIFKTGGQFVTVPTLDNQAVPVGGVETLKLRGTDNKAEVPVELIISNSGGVKISQNGTANVGGANSSSVAIGNSTTSTFINSVAIGTSATATNGQAVAIGGTALASGSLGVSIGSGCQATGTQSIALGNGCISSDNSTICIGKNTNASTVSSVSIGDTVTSSGTKNITIGSNVTNDQAENVIIGHDCTTEGINTTLIGNQNTISVGGSSNTSIGFNNNVQNGSNNIIVGDSNNVVSDGNICIGQGSTISADTGLIIGNGSFTTPSDNLIIGHNSSASSTFSTVIGHNASSGTTGGATYNLVIGRNTTANSGNINCNVVGNNSAVGANVLYGSVFGCNSSINSGNNGTIVGQNTVSNGSDDNTIIGYSNSVVQGNKHIVLGVSNTVSNTSNIIVGNNNNLTNRVKTIVIDSDQTLSTTADNNYLKIGSSEQDHMNIIDRLFINVQAPDFQSLTSVDMNYAFSEVKSATSVAGVNALSARGFINGTWLGTSLNQTINLPSYTSIIAFLKTYDNEEWATIGSLTKHTSWLFTVIQPAPANTVTINPPASISLFGTVAQTPAASISTYKCYLSDTYINMFRISAVSIP